MTGPSTGLALAALVLGVGLFLLDRVALKLIQPPFKPFRKPAFGFPHLNEDISISSGDQSLKGQILRPYPENDTGGPILILVHGWGSNRGTVARLAGPLLRAGYPALLFDVRHHGKSRGAPYVTARHFRDDILAAVEEAGKQFPTRPRVLIGHSMGGSAGVIAVAEGASVQGLICIGAPADLWEVWAYHFNRKGLPGKWIVKVLSPFWRLRAGLPWKTLDPCRRARELDLPLLILHGDEDESVPVSQARLLAQAGRVEPHILRGEGHTEMLESPDLEREVLRFLERIPL